MVAALNDHPDNKWMPANYDRQAFYVAKQRAIMSDSERATFDAIERLTLFANFFTPCVQLKAGDIAQQAMRPVSSVEKALISLKKRGILVIEAGRKFPYNEANTIGINPEFCTWESGNELYPGSMDMELPKPARPSMELQPTATPYTAIPKPANPLKNLKSLEDPKNEEINTCNNNASRASLSDISLDRKKEQSDDQAILDHLAATVPPEPIRYRPLLKTDQTRPTVSPGASPEPAFVAWREGFAARYGHEPGRMDDDLRRLLLDLSREYPTVIDRVVRGYFGWTTLDEGKITLKGLEKVLEKELAACVGNPNRTPFPPDAPVPKPSFSAPPPKRLLKIDPQKRTTNPDGSQRLPPAGWRDRIAPQETQP